MTTAVTFCGRCGEREDLCACDRARPVLDQVRDAAHQAARAIEAPRGKRSPALAAVLSLLIPGLGQLYNGEIGKAVLFLLGWILVIPWALAVMDAYYAATVLNLEERIRSLELN